MKHKGTCCVLLYCITLWTVVDSYNYQVYVMEDTCRSGIQSKREIQMEPNDAAGKLRLSRNSRYRSKLDCEYTIRAPPGKKLVVTFNWINIHGRWGLPCGGDTLKIYNDHKLIGVPLCGYYVNPGVTFIINSGIGRFQMVSNDDYVDRTGFELTYTAFHDGQCTQSEFRCKAGICVDSALKCEGNNNCGDWSDDSCTYAKCKCKGLVAGAIVGLVFASLFIVGMIIIAILCCCRANKRAKEAANKPPTMQAHVIAFPQTTAPPLQQTYMTTTTPYQAPAVGNQAYNNQVYDNPPPYPGSKQ